MNLLDKLYSFTKIQGTIKTWTFQGIAEDGRKIYRSNYGEVYHLSPFKIENQYFEKEEDCFVAWVNALEKKKQQIIKRFEKKFDKRYQTYLIEKSVLE